MNILAFKHLAFDDLHALSWWSQRNGHTLSVRDPSQGCQTEWLDHTDMLVILGGSMSVYQEASYPWLTGEKRFIEQAVQRNKKILGICFGAQLLAELLGGRVYRHSCKEIGWHGISRTMENHPWFNDMPDRFYSFQWHGDTFDLPPGAKRLAWSEGCPNQAFSYGDHIVGLQFHLEATPACVEEMLNRWAKELVDEPYIQSAEHIRREIERSSESFRMLHRILDLASFDDR